MVKSPKYTKTTTKQILHHKNTSKMKKFILNNLLTSAAIIFVFTIGAQTKTQVRYFKESNYNFQNPTILSFSNSLLTIPASMNCLYKQI